MHYFARLCPPLKRLETYGWNLLLLGIRLWMAHIFWKAGKFKLYHMTATIHLFRFEYKVPYFPPDVAAYLTTFFEVICPVLLVLGLMTRLTTIPLLVIVAIIQWTYTSCLDHLYWALLLGVLLLKGAGVISLDAIWCQRRNKGDS
jgi:putative oxidoreductase